jgi:deoxycytidylate deaminase
LKVKWLNGIIKKIKEWLDVKRNVHWIKKHKKDLREKYGGKSIIVYNQKVIATECNHRNIPMEKCTIRGSVWYEVPSMKQKFEQHIINIKYER